MERNLLAGSLSVGRIASIARDGSVLADVGQDSESNIRCVVLESAVAGGPLHMDDRVVLLHGDQTGGLGLVLGRVAMPWEAATTPLRGVSIEAGDDPDAPPDTLVLEARESLTLRVGDGSITIRKDGKILIKGKDLVSIAERMNRIKGGAVSIN